MIRLRVLGVLVASGLLVAASAGAAHADPPGSGSGSTSSSSADCQGVNCYLTLLNSATVTGANGASVSPAGSPANTVDIVPPHCWMQPWLDAADMYAWWQVQGEDTLGDGGPAYLKYVPQINQEYKDKAAGMWWAPNNDGSIAGTSGSCTSLPLLEWVPAGQAPAELVASIPPLVLAQYAYSRMTLPDPGIVLNPAGTKPTFVKLPTFVSATIQQQNPSITATLDGETETVTAHAGGLQISLGGGAPTATVYPSNGKCYWQGSKESAAVMNSAGVGTQPDCGFVFQAPSAGAFTVTAQETWTADWDDNGHPQPLGQPAPTTSTAQLAGVNEIQSTNTGT